MKSHRFSQFLALSLLAFVTFGFAAVSHTQAEQIIYFSLDTDPGWSRNGQWAFGVPAGGGSSCGDPTSGHTGTNVYGYNLAGDYSNSMPAYRVRTTPINCSGYENVALSFWRWLGVESSAHDHATVDVSHGDGIWTTVWNNTTSTICDSSWIKCTYDISAVADNQPTVYIRWVMGPTDGAITYPGWNIDDISLNSELTIDLDITPVEGFASSGYQGGPFTPAGKDYTLTNTGADPINWTAVVTASWLSVEPNCGTLAGANDVNFVQVSINSNAVWLGVGTHTAEVTFTNLTSGIVQNRPVELEVTPIHSSGVIFSDSFPSTTLDTSKWISQISVPTIDNVGLEEPSPPYSLRLNGNPGGGDAVESKILDLSVYDSAQLKYWYEQTGGGESPDTGDDLIIEYWNGSTWVELERQLGSGSNMTSYVQSEVNLPMAALHAGFRVRFLSIGTAGAYDDWFVDDIELIGQLADDLSITPAEGIDSSGYQGGPFTPAGKDYTLTNTGASSINWAAAIMASWLSVEPNCGTFLPSETNIVTVSLNAEANALPPGDYNEMIMFRNVTSGFVQTRQATLKVIAIPGELDVTDTIPPADDLNMPLGQVIIGLSRTEQITITNTDPTYDLNVTDINLSGVQPAYGTSDLSITLPAVEAGSPKSGDYYTPADRAGYAKAESQLVVPAGYKMLSDKVDVLLLASGADPTILRIGLAAFPDINSVGYFDAKSAVPTLAQLSNYDVVVVMSNYPFYSAVQTGNVLADYVDGGGKVIESVASFATGAGWELAGRFVTGDYEPFGHGPAEYFAHSLGNFDNTHPIMAGIMTLTDSVPVGVTLKPQAIWVASWNNGTPLVATRNENVVGINIYAFDTGSWTGDVVLLFHNAAAWLVGQGTAAAGFTLTDVPSLPTVIPPGDNITFNVIFEPTELKEYNASVVIKSNDSDESKVMVSLNGTGISDYLEIVPDVNFTFSGHPGGPFVPSSAGYQLNNAGPLQVSWTVVGPSWLDIVPTGGNLPAGYSITVDVRPNHNATLLPKGIYDVNLVFANATTGKTHYRKVILNVRTDPKIWTNPHLYDATTHQGQDFTDKLTIGNTGDAGLEFSLVGTGLNYAPPKEETGEPLMLELDEEYVSSLQEHDFSVPEDEPYVEGELLVRFAPDANSFLPTSQKRGLLISAALGAEAQEKQQFKIVPGLSLVKLPEGVTVKEALAALSSDTTILYAQPNYEYKALITIPNDVRFSELWGMHNTGQNGGTPGADINAPEAWDIATGTGSIVVAVIDTGVDYTHPDLADNMWVNEAEFNGTPGVDDDGNGYIDDIYGYDFVNNDGNPMDDHYHGTHCAGTIGAVGDNALGVTGVCWSLKIMAVKFLPAVGSGTTANAILSVQYATEMDARVMSNSWGGGAYDQALKDAIDAAGDAGILFIASAGNDNLNNDVYPHYPSSYDSENIISVMATDKYDARSSFSNYGPVTVDLGAPGTDILSCSPGSGYRLLSGTSMATPHVAGACALLLSVDPRLEYDEVKDLLLQNVDTTLPGLCVSNGRMNLHRAMLTVKPASWLRFEPDLGLVSSEGSQDVNIIFDGNQPPGMYEGEITVYSNDPFTPELAIPIRVNLLPRDWFTELFEPNDPWDPNDPYANDMDSTSILFKPDGSGYYRLVCREQVTDFPEDPNGSTTVSLGDDDYEIVDLNGMSVSLYGKEYDRFYIGSNGYISFVSGDTSYLESLEQHFSLPRISALFDDLNPEAGGQISFKMLADKIVVTFENVPDYSLGSLNSFQIEMWFDGKIRLTWLNIGSTTGLAGLSDGTGIPLYFVESNLSDYDQCDFMCDLNNDLDVDFADFAIFGQSWRRRILGPAIVAHWKFNESEGITAYDSSGNNHNGTLEDGACFVGGLINNAVELDGTDGRVSAGTFDVTGGDGHITIAAWIYADDFDVMDARIISKTASDAVNSHYWALSTIFSGSIKPCFYLKCNGTTEMLIPSSGYLIPEIWTHIAATWDGSTMKLYKDGIPVGSRAKSGVLDANNNVKVAIGNQPADVPGKPFDGLIDDLRIYNVALSQSEIQELVYGYEYEDAIRAECDFYPDGVVDGKDLWIFIEHWLK